jgi:aryl-alcohol dehydrogenase-like predicted oxidoreductase
MKKRLLKNTSIEVSSICLGTMTFGEQNSLDQSHKILDFALDSGINFFDTAEMYPIPPNEKTHFQTEEIIGKWSNFHTRRSEIIMATKIIGPSSFMKYIRGGSRRIKSSIREAVTGSLSRLQTDYVDLYQIHWPARPTNFFGQLGYSYPKELKDDQILETLQCFEQLKKEGLIRTYGISNETPWGMMKYQQFSLQEGYSGISTIQNPYNLLNRTFEIGMSEVCHQEGIQLLAYSPLGFGVLTGKYITKNSTPNDRLNLFPDYHRYSNPAAVKATTQYLELANSLGVSLTQLALQFVTTRPFLVSNIIGATNIEQLEENIKSTDFVMTDEIIKQIEAIHLQHPNPSP